MLAVLTDVTLASEVVDNPDDPVDSDDHNDSDDPDEDDDDEGDSIFQWLTGG